MSGELHGGEEGCLDEEEAGCHSNVEKKGIERVKGCHSEVEKKGLVVGCCHKGKPGGERVEGCHGEGVEGCHGDRVEGCHGEQVEDDPGRSHGKDMVVLVAAVW